jgi:hypothetical protein
MLVQPRLPLVLAQRPRQRRNRRPFHPPNGGGSYRLPHDIRDRLTAALAPFRNRDAAFTLATFIARFWSAPGKIVEAFHIDRRALAEHGELDLTEKRIRSAIRTLEEIGFLDRAVTSGSRYKATEDGLRRKPIRFQFGSEYAPLFIAANGRAAVRRERGSEANRTKTLVSSHRASTGSAEARAGIHQMGESLAKGPKSKSEADRPMNLGPLVKRGLPPQASEPNPNLEAALERLRKGVFGKAGAGEGNAVPNSERGE